MAEDDWGVDSDLEIVETVDTVMDGTVADAELKTDEAVEDDGDDGFGDEDDSWDDDGGADADGGWDDAEEDGHKALRFGDAPMSDFHERHDVPEVTFQSLTHNCVEVNMLPMFAAVPDLSSRMRVGAVLGIRIDQLANVTEEQLEVWNITPEFNFITIKMEFDPFYLSESKLPRIEVGISKELNVTETLEQFRLSWTILERTKNVMLSPAKWPPTDIAMTGIPDASHINDLMEMSGGEYALCHAALAKAEGDKTHASSYLFSDTFRKELEAKLPSLAACREELKDIVNSIIAEQAIQRSQTKGEEWTDSYSSADDKTKAKQLSEAFGVSLAAALLMIKKLGYDMAAAQLVIPGIKDQFELEAVELESMRTAMGVTSDSKEEDEFYSTMGVTSAASSSSKVSSLFGGIKSMFGGKKRRSLSSSTGGGLEAVGAASAIMRTMSDGQINQVAPESVQRTMAVMMRHNFLLRILVFALKVLMNGNKYCMICDQQLVFAGLKPSICTEPFCQFRHDQIGLGFSLASELLFRAELTDLLVSCCYAACVSRRIEIFFPESVRGVDEFSEESFMQTGGKTADTEKLMRFLANDCPAILEMKEWAKDGDFALKAKMKTVSPLLYPLLVWIITSNRSHLRKLKPEEEIKGLKTRAQFTLASATPAKEAEFQHIQATNGSFLAFHGSPLGNWHSIYRMGLKNYSSTKRQMHGAAYGSGIYLATNFSYSAGYCKYRAGNSWPKSMFGAGLSCMAVCEVCYHDDDVGKGGVLQSASAVDSPSLSATPSPPRVKKKTSAAATTPASAHPRHRKGDSKNKWLKTTGIYVVDREEYVMTRFFLLFEGPLPQTAIDGKSLKIPKVVKSS